MYVVDENHMIFYTHFITDYQILLNSFNLKNPDIHHQKHTFLCIIVIV